MTSFKRQTTFTKSVGFNRLPACLIKHRLRPTTAETQSRLYSRLLQRNVTARDAMPAPSYFSASVSQSVTMAKKKKKK